MADTCEICEETLNETEIAEKRKAGDPLWCCDGCYEPEWSEVIDE